MMKLKQLLHPLVNDLEVNHQGWASHSLALSMRRVVLIAVAGWQAGMIIAISGSVGVSAWPLIAGHVVLIAFVLFAVRWPLPVWLVPIMMAALGVCSLVISGDIESVLVIAACWQLNFAGCAAGIMVFSRAVIPCVIGGAVVTAGLVMISLPAWGLHLPLAIILTQTSIVLGLRFGLRPLFQLSRQADYEESEAAEAAHQDQVARSVSKQVAEEGRLLHDTAINTLAAIAVSNTLAADRRQVREQCAKDVVMLKALRSDKGASPLLDVPLRAIFELPGLPVVRTGINDVELSSLEDRLPLAQKNALVGCVREAVTNAVKHSGAHQVEINLAVRDEVLAITVRDGGIGFNGVIPPGRGIDNSILARARDFGAYARVTSGIGAGTEVYLTLPLNHLESPGSPFLHAFDDASDVVENLRRSAGLLWAIGVTIVSVVLTVAGGANHYWALFPMVAIMLIASGVLSFTRPPSLSVGTFTLLALANLTVFALSAAATNFGSSGVAHWQALAATGPFVLILSFRPPRLWLLGAVVAWVLLAASLVIAIAPGSLNAAGVVVVAGCVGLLFSLVWWRFQETISAIGLRAASAHRRGLESRAATAAATAAQATYQRWNEAGLDSSIEILRDIAEGERDPAAPETQRLCGDEETYLRQLVMISPELMNLGQAILPMLRLARDQGIQFRLRLGSQDAPDRTVATAIAEAIAQALTAVTPGREVTASVYPVEQGIQLTLTGPRLPFEDMSVETSATMIKVEHERMGRIELAQLTFGGDVNRGAKSLRV